MELHLVIIWENARYKEQLIIEDLKKKFVIHQIYDITWSPELVSSNFSRFYGVNLPLNSFKETECGTGEFRLIIIEDNNPIYDYRLTSKGEQIVNTNLFDAKTKYREWTGGGHKIHATNNTFEYEHDISLLLGYHELQCIYKSPASIIPQKKHIDIIGANGWNSVEELFNTLNRTIEYVTLRGGSNLINDAIDTLHRDVDILTPEPDNAILIINGDPLPTTRPHELITINNKEYVIDIWGTSIGYFDPSWEEEMLHSRKLDNFLYILNRIQDYYCLLYHCLIFKGFISESYYLPLKKNNPSPKALEQSPEKELVSFLLQNNYDITLPNDNSINIHTSDNDIHNYFSRYGTPISYHIRDKHYNTPFFSAVYEREHTFYKRASSYLITNEYIHLQKLKEYIFVPKVVASDDYFIETTKIHGVDADVFFSQKKHLTSKIVKSFMVEGTKILCTLIENNILHRDFITKNLIIDISNEGRCNVSIIDFGWATDINNIKQAINPDGLGSVPGYTFNPIDGYSDIYAFGRILERCLPIQSNLQQYLLSVPTDIYESPERLKDFIISVQKISNKPLSIKELLMLFIHRRKAILRICKKSKRFIKRIFIPF